MWIKLTSNDEMSIHDVKFICALQGELVCCGSELVNDVESVSFVVRAMHEGTHRY